MNQLKYLLQAFGLLAVTALLYIFTARVISTGQIAEQTVVTDPQPVKMEYVASARGKQLFTQYCAACHHLFKSMTGPSLCGFEDRGPWKERNNIYLWIRNPGKFLLRDAYTRQLKEKFSGTLMTGFPHLTNEEIDEIIRYIDGVCKNSDAAFFRSPDYFTSCISTSRL